MKKKVLSALLSVCLFVGIAVPAFAFVGDAYNTSSVGGSDEEITELVFDKESLTIPNSKSEDLKKLLTAYVGKDKIVQNPQLEWSITDSLAFGIDDNGVVTNIGEDKGEATVTVKANEKSASIKVVASAKAATPNATGFKFSETKYTTTDGATVVDLEIVPTPSGANFTADQKADIEANFGGKLTVSKADGTSAITGAPTFVAADDKAVASVTLSSNDVADYKVALTDAQLLRDKDNSKYYSKVTRVSKISVVEGKAAAKVIRTGTAKVEVGDTLDLNDYIAFTTGANYNKEVTWSLELYDDNALTEDYAVQNTSDDNMILGVAVGKLKAVATMIDDANACKNDSDAVATVIVEVVSRGAIPSIDNASITPTTGAIKVGETLAIEAKNVGDAEVSWSVNNGKLATVTMKGTKTTFKALAAGTVTVTAKVGDTVIGTATVTISAADSSKPDGTGNPQTGDSLFSNLF